MAINKDEWRERHGIQRKARNEVQGAAEGRLVTGHKPLRTAAVRDPYHALGDLLESGQFRRLLVRADGAYGATWTLKAVLDLPEGGVPVYMHGSVKHHGDLPSVIDYCLQKGDWRYDKHAGTE